jgi:exonuclease SbcC
VRPLRVEVEGFSAFRERTVVSFAETDLFAFVGPTGAGKSSVIDAITFALYGAVSRYNDLGAVAPVINAQSAEAKVRLDFEVGGIAYTAVRVVRRQRDKASTREARLERNGEVLAGKVSELDAAVEGLLGLNFEQFTKTVVLPQGDFAAFLHATPKDRGDLLVRLLDFGVYARMASAARSRARTAADHAGFLEQQVAASGSASPDDEARARARGVALRTLGESLRDDLVAVDQVDQALADVVAAGKQLQAQAKSLRDLSVPTSARTFEAERAEAARALEHAVAAVATARSARDAAQLGVAGGPDVAALTAARRDRLRFDELARLIATADAALADARAAAATSEATVAAHQIDADAAAAHVDRMRVRSGAAALRAALHEGEPCPVCEQLVTVVPPVARLDEHAIARDELKQLTDRVKRAQAVQANHTREVVKAETALEHLGREHDELGGRLAGAAGLDAIEAQIERAASLQHELEGAVAGVNVAETAQARAAKVAQTLDGTERTLRSQFHAARDALAALEPPPVGGAGVLADWEDLVAWGGITTAQVEKDLAELVGTRDTLRTTRAGLVAGIEAACAAHGIDGTRPRLLELLSAEASRADADAERVREALARVAQLAAQAQAKRSEQQVAEELGRLLNAAGFQQWLLEEALDELVEGASARLEQLSSGQFSLERSERDFMVRDHRNAEELRSARTLSGGETFLASLALALTLADNVAALSAEGAPKLESIFLDEGFGTLDAETLDVVAAAIEELGAAGRMVGIVTHVRELADRLPVRFEVTKGPSTSTIERIER